MSIGYASSAEGVYEISGGSLTVTHETLGDLQIGRLGFGELIVDGSDATITVAGVRLGYAGLLTSLIDESGISTISAVSRNVDFIEGGLVHVGFADGVTPYEGTWTLIEGLGAEAVFDGVVALADTVDTDFSGDGLGWTMNLDTTNKLLQVTYGVPEPGTIMLLISGMAIILVTRFRKSSH